MIDNDINDNEIIRIVYEHSYNKWNYEQPEYIDLQYKI